MYLYKNLGIFKKSLVSKTYATNISCRQLKTYTKKYSRYLRTFSVHFHENSDQFYAVNAFLIQQQIKFYLPEKMLQEGTPMHT